MASLRWMTTRRIGYDVCARTVYRRGSPKIVSPGLFDSYVHSGYVEVLDACISSEMIGYSPKWVEFDFSRTKGMYDYWHGANFADKAELSL